MAGIPLSQLSEQLKTGRVVRALPNAAAEVGKSYTPWVATAHVNDRDRCSVRGIFDAFGAADEVMNEAEIDYLTGLSGSGPAFPALLATAMMRDDRQQSKCRVIRSRDRAARAPQGCRSLRATSNVELSD
jgi:pyrroline-5-carboxylate reductase